MKSGSESAYRDVRRVEIESDTGRMSTYRLCLFKRGGVDILSVVFMYDFNSCMDRRSIDGGCDTTTTSFISLRSLSAPGL